VINRPSIDVFVLYTENSVYHLGIVTSGIEFQQNDGTFFVIAEKRFAHHFMCVDVRQFGALHIEKIVSIRTRDAPDIGAVPV
jgi:hypothetical protein